MLKVIIFGLIFLISGGAVFSRYFQGKIVLELLAGLIASLSMIYLIKDVVHEELKQQVPGVEASAGNKEAGVEASAGNKEAGVEASAGNKEAGVEASAGNKEAVTPPVSIPVLVSPPPPKPVSLPVPPPEAGNISDIFNPKRDKFEKTSEFQARREQLLAKSNQASQQGDSRYQAGVASLKDYNADAESLFVTLEWQATWVKSFATPKLGVIKIAPPAAKIFWQEGPQKLLYVQMERLDEQLKIKSGVLTGNGQVWYINLLPLPEVVTIPAGSFRMGDIQGTGESNEQPVHTVQVKSFAMSRHEVTFEEYDYFAEQTGREKPKDKGWGRGNRPVINVSWEDATAYAEWLSQVTGELYRLPTEAEWEYAARAGTETDSWWGKTASHEYANYGKDECCGGLVQGKDQWEFTAPVCSFVDNPFGLCDTVGNVWEWTCSEYEEKYNGKELECTRNNRANNGSLCVIRGGAWLSKPRWVRASSRFRDARADRDDNVGFRLVRM